MSNLGGLLNSCHWQRRDDALTQVEATGMEVANRREATTGVEAQHYQIDLDQILQCTHLPEFVFPNAQKHCICSCLSQPLHEYLEFHLYIWSDPYHSRCN